MKYKLLSYNPEQTIALGTLFGRHLRADDVVALIGILGGGKTYFTKGIAQGLGVKNSNEIISPSFTLCHIHKGKKLTLYHLDVQRLRRPADFKDLGIIDFFPGGVAVIEWADKFLKTLAPLHIIKVLFKVKGRTKRQLEFSFEGKRFTGLVNKLKSIITTSDISHSGVGSNPPPSPWPGR